MWDVFPILDRVASKIAGGGCSREAESAAGDQGSCTAARLSYGRAGRGGRGVQCCAPSGSNGRTMFLGVTVRIVNFLWRAGK